jgi:hypothetical protein
MQTPTIGCIVLYTLTEAEAAAINKRREDYKAFAREHVPAPAPGEPGASGHQSHVGNSAREGDQYPAVVVRVFDPSSTTANLQVFLDGNDTYWATSAKLGEGPYTYQLLDEAGA